MRVRVRAKARGRGRGTGRGRLRVRYGEAHCGGGLHTGVDELYGVGLSCEAVGGGGEVALDSSEGDVLHELCRARLQGGEAGKMAGRWEGDGREMAGRWQGDEM